MTITLEEFMIIRKSIGRSGFGKDGKGEYRESKLCDMSNTWIDNSIKFVENNNIRSQMDHVMFYKMELDYRESNGIYIPDDEPLTMSRMTVKKINF